MKIACISDVTYRACLPDDPHCLSYYGSEPYHAILAAELVRQGHEVEWYAPWGSTPIGNYHPLRLFHGRSLPEDSITKMALDGSKTEDLLSCDFVIDMSASARNVEDLVWFHNFTKHVVYRNGYVGFAYPRIDAEHRHFVVPSNQNKGLFKERGNYESDVVYYGIPEFYCPGHDEQYWEVFRKKYGLEEKNYYIFPHRPHPDKGTRIIIELAKTFSQETFVVCANVGLIEHALHLNNMRREVQDLHNLIFVDIPQNPKHHYYKRELLRNAKAALSPIMPGYYEGFGLSTAEAIACGTPAIISDSPSTRELWRDGSDVIIVEGSLGFKMAIDHFSSYDLKPENNRYKVENYAKGYLELAKKYA